MPDDEAHHPSQVYTPFSIYPFGVATQCVKSRISTSATLRVVVNKVSVIPVINRTQTHYHRPPPPLWQRFRSWDTINPPPPKHQAAKESNLFKQQKLRSGRLHSGCLHLQYHRMMGRSCSMVSIMCFNTIRILHIPSNSTMKESTCTRIMVLPHPHKTAPTATVASRLGIHTSIKIQA